MKRLLKQLTESLLVLAGILSAGMGIKGFLLSSHFIDGGVTGISMLIAQVTRLLLPWLIPVINLPFVVIGYQQIGRRFALRSSLAILGLAAVILLVPFPDVTHDKLLTAIFGGCFLGAGIGLTIRGGAVLDGTEIAALMISKVHSLLRVGDVILLFNCVIFLSAAFFLGIEPALYSILTYLSASRTVNFLLHGIEEYMAVTIVSSEHEAIRQRIIHELKRSVTLYKGAGGVSGAEQDILFCVVTKLEINSIKAVARDIDAAAFIVIHPIDDADGGVIKKAAYR